VSRFSVLTRDASAGEYLCRRRQLSFSEIGDLRGQFPTVDENGLRIFSLTTTCFTVVPLAKCASRNRSNLSSGRTPLWAAQPLRSAAAASSRHNGDYRRGKASATFKDMHSLTMVTRSRTTAAHRFVITNPDDESAALNPALPVN
jgi:hypothetical protein